MQISEAYAPRPIRFLEEWQAAPGWRLKVYSIAYGREQARPEAVAAAKERAEKMIPPTGGYGVGFLGVHDGRGAVFAFLDWWEGENELHHHVWVAPADHPTALKPVVDNNPSVCVWDIAVQWHERQAWVTHVLANPDGPDLEGYLSERLDGEV